MEDESVCLTGEGGRRVGNLTGRVGSFHGCRIVMGSVGVLRGSCRVFRGLCRSYEEGMVLRRRWHAVMVRVGIFAFCK